MCIRDRMTFKMRPSKFQIDEETFHAEVCSWPGVEMEVKHGVYHYTFTGMMLKPLPGETPDETMVRVSRL